MKKSKFYLSSFFTTETSSETLCCNCRLCTNYDTTLLSQTPNNDSTCHTLGELITRIINVFHLAQERVGCNRHFVEAIFCNFIQ